VSDKLKFVLKSFTRGVKELPYCQKCGSEVLVGDSYCISCGSKLRQVTTGGHASAPIEVLSTLKTSQPVQEDAKTNTAPETKDYGRYGPAAFPKDILTDSEVPLYETRPLLWITMMSPAVLLLFGLAIVIIAYVYSNSAVVLYLLGLLLLIGGLWVLAKWLRWRYTIFAATNRRILFQSGILSKSYVDCSLGKVQTVYVEVSFFGKMNNFGTVRVATAGEATVEIEWKDVKDPTKTQRILNEIIDKYTRGTA
jgi:membrane protein YdbS with pleckstrin-like domain